jgi:glycosylphosphatidylinositol transamidase
LSYWLVVLPSVTFINITGQVVDLAKPPQTAALLKAFNLCWAGMIIAVTAVVNFSLSAATAVLLGISLSVVPSIRPNSLVKLFTVAFLVALTPQGMMALLSHIIGYHNVLHWARSVISDYEVVGSYFVPFVWMVYLPLVLQGMLSCILA